MIFKQFQNIDVFQLRFQVPVFMYAATITKPHGGQSCNIFWPFNDDESFDNDTDSNSTSNSNSSENENDPEAEGRPHVLNGQTAFTFYSFVLGFAIPLLLILGFYVQVKLLKIPFQINSQ
jgi:hypothetical protein